MKISFLVTYYNQEQYVRQSMDSVLAIEKPAEWEILVGDDGSSDETVDIVNEYIRNDPEHIRLYVMPREAGKRYDAVKRASANRLNLLEHCSGDCFCTLDGDDFYFDAQFVLEAIDVLDRHDDVSVVSFGYRHFRDGEFEQEGLLPAGVGPRVDTKYYIRNFYLHAGAAVHRLRWEKNRIEYIKKIGSFDDNDIVMNSLNYGNMYYINRSVYAYRQTGESIYTRMQSVEKAVLNTLAYDIEKLIIDQSGCLAERYKRAILVMYLWRNRIEDILGDAKYDQYVEECKHLDHAVSYKLLVYGRLSKSEKKEIRKLVLRSFFQCICKVPRKLFFKMQKARTPANNLKRSK